MKWSLGNACTSVGKKRQKTIVKKIVFFCQNRLTDFPPHSIMDTSKFNSEEKYHVCSLILALNHHQLGQFDRGRGSRLGDKDQLIGRVENSV